MRAALALVLVAAAASSAVADDYCAHVQAVADAESALQVAPELFGSAGYSKQSTFDQLGNTVSTAGPRVTAGLAYDFTGLLERSATRGRARAECARHLALARVEQAATTPQRRALAARAAVLDAALTEADAIAERVAADVKERLVTERELVATRLRIDELRRHAAETRRELAILGAQDATVQGSASRASSPAVSTSTSLSSALAGFYSADAEVERHAARLRRFEAFDLRVRGGYDRYLDASDDTPYFAMLQLSVNLGSLFQGGANERSASARQRWTRNEQLASTLAPLQAQLAADTTRTEQTAALIADLEAQLATLARLAGDDARRYRQTLWFDVVTLKAEHAFVTTRAAAIREALPK